MSVFLIFVGWFVLSVLVGSFVGTIIAFGTGSLDETNTNN